MADPITYEERRLLDRVAAGDETAFTTLFHRWHQPLGQHIFSIIKSRPLTEEIVQDVFVKVWQTRESLLEINNFSDYLFIVTRNRAISALRKLLTEQQRRQAFEKIATRQGQSFSESDHEEMGLSLIDEAIKKLPPQRQKCFVLSRQQRLTYEQIAAQLGIGRETVKTHIQAAVADITRYVRAEMDRTLLLLWLALCLN